MLGFNRCKKCGYWVEDSLEKFEENDGLCEGCVEESNQE
jgi:hypothetical protein